MSPDRERDALEAQQLINNPLLTRVLADIERDAMERAISAGLTDDAMRSAACGEVRAVRAFTSSLTQIVAEASIRQRKGGVA